MAQTTTTKEKTTNRTTDRVAGTSPLVYARVAGLLLLFIVLIALLAVWDLVGYTTILCGSVLEVLGFNLLTIHAIPGGLWEVFIGVWLIVRGFKPSAFASESDDGVLTGVRQPTVVPSNGHPAPSTG